MRKYTRLSDSGSLNDGTLPEFSPPFATEYDLNPTTRWGKASHPSLDISPLLTDEPLIPGGGLPTISRFPSAKLTTGACSAAQGVVASQGNGRTSRTCTSQRLHDTHTPQW